MQNLIATVEAFFDRLGSVSSLLTRLVVGGVFAVSGWGKLTHLDKTIEFFQSLAIPFPQLQAPFVAATELGCGLLLIVGLFARFAALPLCGVMAVALATAKLDEIDSLRALSEISEFLYILLLLWLVTQGAGALSLDRWLRKRK